MCQNQKMNKFKSKMFFDASHSDQLNLLFIPNFTMNFYGYVTYILWLYELGIRLEKLVFFPYFS